MKKILALVLAMMLAAMGLSACSSRTVTTQEATEAPTATPEPATAAPVVTAEPTTEATAEALPEVAATAGA